MRQSIRHTIAGTVGLAGLGFVALGIVKGRLLLVVGEVPKEALGSQLSYTILPLMTGLWMVCWCVTICPWGRMLAIPFSPTYVLADCLKTRHWSRCDTARFLRRWSHCGFYVAIGAWITIYVLSCYGVSFVTTAQVWPHSLVLLYLWVFPFSRCNEIFRAFIVDPLRHIRGIAPSTPLEPVDRIKLLAFSYFEITVNFGLIYFLAFNGSFSNNFRDIAEAVYFSGATITTLGSDFNPCGRLAQFVVIYEVIIGLTLIVVAFSTYLGSVKGQDNRRV
jgi:voltage-gated potassium channel